MFEVRFRQFGGRGGALNKHAEFDTATSGWDVAVFLKMNYFSVPAITGFVLC